ncbi:PAS domain-containing protein [Oscillibacter sp.]|uniref:PAS domain-containing protein n=1 Tax=Oscillibacter sp. TaxID=1945593 RepID=UPI002629916E|nr:PAS domain-containing protein [Oscillibacter sp.]MDD3347498.1 PAS domain-containing protein [Oscillibacter sp.]
MEFAYCREILDSWPMGILFCDLDHVIRYMNPAAEYYYYVTRSYRDLVGKSVLDCHRPETRERILALVEELKAGGGEKRIGTTKIEGYRVYITPVRDKDGTLIGYVDRFEDGKDGE